MADIRESWEEKERSQRKEKIIAAKALVKKYIYWGVIAVVLMFGAIFAPKIFDTVEKGTYQIKQTAIFGTMYAKMDPGIWWQLFGDIEEWPKAETFFFTKDKLEGKNIDQSIEVRYNDGSLCDISGTLRILLPISPTDAINLVIERGHKSYADVEQKLILPTMRNALRLTANLMSARESYAEKRTDFIFWAADQIQNGLYQTTEEIRPVKDIVSGEMVNKTFKVIKMSADKITPLYQQNPLAGTGIKLANFEVKSFEYAPVVKKQISEQQKAIMDIATAKANAQKAEQEKITIEAQGAAKVAKAKFKELEVKAVSVVIAQRNKEVAETDAQRDLAVAILNRKAAKETKQRDILIGQGQAEKKRLVMLADGALKQKLDALKIIHKYYAEAYSKRLVPSVYMGGGSSGGPDNEFSQFMGMMNTYVAKQLAVDMGVKGLKR